MTLVAPSWLVPGTWLENVELARTQPWIEGVELLFFSFDEEARAVLAVELPGIDAAARRFSLSVHLPDPLGPRDAELVEMTAGFAAIYVLHPPRPDESISDGTAAWASLVGSFRKRYGDRFLLEYTGRFPFAAAEFACPGLPLCADTGRLILDGEEPAAWIEARAGRVREVHIHEVENGKDHAALVAERAWLRRLAPLVERSEMRAVMEVFSLAGATASAEAFRAAAGDAGARGSLARVRPL
jgi:sugar phosphate isomerase/epimerase